MVRDVKDDRKRALVLGKFKFLYQEDSEELETLDKFQLAVVQVQLYFNIVFFKLLHLKKTSSTILH